MRIIVTLLLMLSAARLAAATAPVIGTTTFNNNFSATVNIIPPTASPISSANVGVLTPSGWDFTATAAGSTMTMSAAAAGANPGGASDFCIRMNSQTSGISVQNVAVKSDNGLLFQLQSVYLKLNILTGGSANITLTGYRSNNPVSGATLTINNILTTVWTEFNVGANTAFSNVDEFRFTATGITTTITFQAVDQITIAPAINLPLTLLDFSGQRQDNKVNLQWTTAQEENTAGFEVQRGNNGADFTTVGLVKAAGNSTQTLHYSYTDTPPVTSSPAFFYRLKMSDLDGRSTYSPVLRISDPSSGLSFSAYPNPFQGHLVVTMNAPEADKAQLTIRDMNGKQLLRQDLSIQKGANSFPLPAMVRLPKGLYLLNLATSRQQETIRVLKIE